MRNTLTKILTPALASAALLVGIANAADVIITIEDVRAGGDLYIALQTEGQFMKNEGDYGEIVQDTEGGDITITLTDIPAGDYALSVWHDIDDDAVFDMSEQGLPEDGWAMSNQSELRGMPTFEIVHFTVADEDVELTESVIYSN